MISLDTYGGKSQVLLGFLLLASYVLLELPPNDLAMRDALPIDPAITRMVNCNTPLPRAVVPLFHPNGFLKLSDQNQNTQRDNIWYTFEHNTDVVSAQLLCSGKMVLKKNGTKVTYCFDNSLPIYTIGQAELFNKSHNMISWQNTSFLFLRGQVMNRNQSTDRTSYLRNQTVGELPQPWVAKRDNKLAKILGWTSASAGVLLFVVAIFCLWRYEKVRQWLWACGRCGSCCRRPKPCYEIKFPGDTPVTVEPGDGGVELEVEERGPAVYCMYLYNTMFYFIKS